MKKALLYLCVLLTGLLNGQTNGNIYGFSNPSSGVFWFSRLDLTTGVFTQMQQMPWSSYNTGCSSCADDFTQTYFYCSTTEMYHIDPLTGNVLATNILPIAPTAQLYHIQFNPCDSMIYGIVNDYPDSIYFIRYHPGNGTVDHMGLLPSNLMFAGGGMAVIDQANGLYIFQGANYLMGINITTGQIVFNTTYTNIPNESFGHISYDCTTGEIYGTSANTIEQEKFFATIDPWTGTISHVSGFSWPNGFWKLSSGGNCIDQDNDIYYYSGTPDLIVAIDISTGDTVRVYSTGAGNMIFIQHFSQCECLPTSVSETETSSLTVYPNPAGDFITVTSEHRDVFILTDALGREVMRISLTNPTTYIATETLADGVYLWRTADQESQGKLLINHWR